MEEKTDAEAGPFAGLAVGRIVHVCFKLPVGNCPVVERPAIVTEVKDKEQGVISAQVFKSPDDPPGEVFVTQPGRIARPLGTEINYSPHREYLRPWTWHWPEFVE